MAHFAKINSKNTVLTVVKIKNGPLLDDEGNEVEQKGIDFCKSLYGQNTRWVQCSWNTDKGVHYTEETGADGSLIPSVDQSKAFRKNYPGPASIYDASRDAFIYKKIFPSWSLNESSCDWEAPVAKPEYDFSTHRADWNEETQSWDVVIHATPFPDFSAYVTAAENAVDMTDD
tara:strand:- start:3349 stop:3867 length:519 start_codon:yes stop_codon:yes gene_type:complete